MTLGQIPVNNPFPVSETGGGQEQKKRIQLKYNVEPFSPSPPDYCLAIKCNLSIFSF